jgi:hypothetical protein
MAKFRSARYQPGKEIKMTRISFMYIKALHAVLGGLLVATLILYPSVGMAQEEFIKSDTFEAGFNASSLQTLKNSSGLEFISSTNVDMGYVHFGKERRLELKDAVTNTYNLDNRIVAVSTWPEGQMLTLDWRVSNEGDLVLNASAISRKEVQFFGLAIPGFSLEAGNLIMVSNWGIAKEFENAFTSFPIALDSLFFPEYVHPLVALFKGKNGGLFVEGRNADDSMANLKAVGHGRNVTLVFLKGYPEGAKQMSLYEIRFRPYEGKTWYDAVDPHVKWMEDVLGFVPLEKREVKWPLSTYAYIYCEDIYRNKPELHNPILLKKCNGLDPKQTLLGKVSNYRLENAFCFDHGYPYYEPTLITRKHWLKAHEIGLKVAAHVNSMGIDNKFPDLIERFSPGLRQKGTKDGKPVFAGHDYKNNCGPVRFSHCSAAYKPWRNFLVQQIRPLVEAGIDTIYLDEFHSLMGTNYIDGQNSCQGAVALQKEILAAYPGITLMTEQFNPVASRHACFALTSFAPGHPLSGYLFHRFIKFTGWNNANIYEADPEQLEKLWRWGFLLPSTDGVNKMSLEIVQAFQKHKLKPAPRLERKDFQLSGFQGDNGVVAYYEIDKNGPYMGLVVYQPNRKPKWFGKTLRKKEEVKQ